MIGALARLLAIVLALAVCAGAALVVYSALGNQSVLGKLLPLGWDSPVSTAASRHVFTVRPGQSAGSVGEELQERNLIRSAIAFRWEVEARGLGSKLEAGNYELSPSMSTPEVVAVLARGATSREKTFTVLEGWRIDQVALKAEELGLGKAEEVLRLARAPREHGLTPPDPAAGTLEGYLYPDTYEFEPDATPAQVLEKMLRQFNRRLDETIKREVAREGLTTHQAVTLASIIEREAADAAERPIISSVYHNRLKAGMKLEADPTVQYAVAGLDLRAALSYGFWKTDLTYQDLSIDSPYNTYRVPSLPSGPICSPGLASIQAAASPAQTSFLFFVARGDGSHAFAQTDQEHESNVRRFTSRN